MHDNIFWELNQQRKIRQAKADAARAERVSGHVEREIDLLTRQVDGLSLGCQALWEILRERVNLTDEDVREKILEIDLRDGQADGKIAKTALDCPSCARKASPTRPTCLYCGADISTVGSHVFE